VTRHLTLTLGTVALVNVSLSGTKGRWRPTRVVNDPADWVVAIGENWANRACGSVTYRDVFDRPEGFAGFGSSANCIGVAFSITVNTSRATKRTTIRCGSRR
jgi:hypothetical protein